MAVSIKDVAKEAGVSISTVSRVLNNIDIVNSDTKQKVLKAIEKLNYRPNIVARSLKTQKTRTIGIIIPDISNQFYAEIVRGAEDVSNIYNYNVILCNTDLNCKKEEEYIHVLEEKMVDGIIYMSRFLQSNILTLLKEIKTPIVLVETRDKDKVFPSVTIDNEKAAYDAVNYLLKRGNTKIGYLGLSSDILNANSIRYLGYKAALKDASIKLDNEIIRFIELNAKDGYLAMKDIIKKGKNPDAIFCASDDVAMGAINALRDEGMNVPKDMDIIGFDNIYASSIFYPKITTVAQPMYDMGSVGMRMLIKIINNEDIDKRHYKLPYHIIERGSCKKR